MNLQQLRYLVEVAERGTMTEAAARLNVSQPALSKAVRNLERELHVTLFEREGRNVVPSAAATEVVEAARRALAAVDDVRRAAGAARRPPLIIAATPTVAAVFAEWAMPVVASDPDARHLRFMSAASPEQVQALVRRGEAELGVVDQESDPDLVGRLFRLEEVVVVAPADSGLPDPVPRRALDAVPLILPSAGSPRRRETDEFFAELGIAPAVALESDDRVTWISAIVGGVGACLWYRTSAAEAARRGARVLALDPPLSRPLHVVHRNGHLSSEARALVDALERPGSAAANDPERA